MCANGGLGCRSFLVAGLGAHLGFSWEEREGPADCEADNERDPSALADERRGHRTWGAGGLPISSVNGRLMEQIENADAPFWRHVREAFRADRQPQSTGLGQKRGGRQTRRNALCRMP